MLMLVKCCDCVLAHTSTLDNTCLLAVLIATFSTWHASLQHCHAGEHCHCLVTAPLAYLCCAVTAGEVVSMEEAERRSDIYVQQRRRHLYFMNLR